MLKEYLLKGFVMDDERLKNPDGRPDYFDEMLARIRDIRASEKRFYQKLRDLFALSSDYDKTDQSTQTFFATVQNLLLYAVTQKTAAELITARANPADPHFGLLHWKGCRPAARADGTPDDFRDYKLSFLFLWYLAAERNWAETIPNRSTVLYRHARVTGRAATASALKQGLMLAAILQPSEAPLIVPAEFPFGKCNLRSATNTNELSRQ